MNEKQRKVIEDIAAGRAVPSDGDPFGQGPLGPRDIRALAQAVLGITQQPRVEGRVRDDLIEIVRYDRAWPKGESEQIVSRILDRLIAATDGELADTFLLAVKRGDI